MIAIAHGMAGACLRNLQPPTEQDRERDAPEPTPEEREFERRLDAYDAMMESLGGRVCHLPLWWENGPIDPDEPEGRIPGAPY